MPNCVCFIVDANFFPPALALARRAVEATTPDVQIHVFVEGAGADAAAIDPLVEAPTSGRLRVHHNALSARIPPAFPATKFLPRVIYARLFAPEYLQCDRLLYLDADILIEDRLDELFTLDMRGRAIAAVHDAVMVAKSESPSRRKTAPIDRHANYFNSGVLLIDRARWAERDVAGETTAFFAKFGAAASLPDQDFLNFACRDDWTPLSPRWNFQSDALAAGLHDAVKPAIVHFTGGLKPWHRETGRDYPPLAAKFRAMMADAGWSPDWRPAHGRTSHVSPLHKLRMTARAWLYSSSVVPYGARARLAEWRGFRDRYVAFLNHGVETGLFADRFAPGPMAEPATPSFDGRTFRVRLAS
jgi:lipopolysaccharide biosynthesis glycosyltransferase